MESVEIKTEPANGELEKSFTHESGPLKNVESVFIKTEPLESEFTDVEPSTSCNRSHLENSTHPQIKRFKTEHNYSETTSDDKSGEWKIITDRRFVPQRNFFTVGSENTGPNIPLNCSLPIDYFKLFFTDCLIEKITNETNKFAQDKLRKLNPTPNSPVLEWKDLTTIEMSAFLGVVLNMGLRSHPNIEDYWNMDLTACSPFYRSIFSYLRFRLILCMLHPTTYNINESQNKINENAEKLEKINSYFGHLNSTFNKYYVPNREIAIEESGFDTSGRICFIRRKLRKPLGKGIQLYTLVDVRSGYVFSFLGKFSSKISGEPSPPHNPETGIVMEFYENLLKCLPKAEGYHIFTDQAISNIELAYKLYSLKTHITSTLNENDVPLDVKKFNLKANSKLECVKNNLMLLMWKDEKYISNWYANDEEICTKINHRGETIIETSPCTYTNYRRFYKETCKTDEFSSTYPFIKIKLKWWKKLFFWGLEMSLINAYILYREHYKFHSSVRMTYIEFIDKLISQLVGSFREDTKVSEDMEALCKEQRLDGKLHIMAPYPKYQNRVCLICDKNKTGTKRKAYYYCETCEMKPALHIGDCFKKYHTSKNYLD